MDFENLGIPCCQVAASKAFVSGAGEQHLYRKIHEAWRTSSLNAPTAGDTSRLREQEVLPRLIVIVYALCLQVLD